MTPIGAKKGRITFSVLNEFIKEHTINEFYEWFGVDYRIADDHVDPTATVDRHSPLNQICWKRNPTSQEIRRLFNQVNTYYAEQWARENLTVEPQEFLYACNHLVLFRQGKPVGFREKPLSFGARHDLDFLDPRRHFQLLYGIAPRLISRAVRSWSDSIHRTRMGIDEILMLVMALIAIHPFSDGNGRVARIAYTWLTGRCGWGDRWLAEADDGEFLRVGTNIFSTEHLMASVILQLCGGWNRVALDGRPSSSDDEDRALEALEFSLSGKRAGNAGILAARSFLNLRQHLAEADHFRSASPRLAALRHLIQS